MAVINHDLASPAWVGDGAGSGLDADTLDTVSSEGFAAAVHTHVKASIVDIASGTVWTSSNDGMGSGLDADLLDGHDTSYFATADHTQALAKGGTNANLSATGGTGQVLRQSSTGANVTVSSLKLTETAAGDNNKWIKATDYAGTGTVNVWKVNTSDEIEVGGPLNIAGPIEFPQDAGVVTLCDTPVVSAADETLIETCMKIAGQIVASILGYSTGAGAIDKLALKIRGDLLPNATNASCLGSATLAFKELHLSDGANEWKITVDTGGNLVTTAE